MSVSYEALMGAFELVAMGIITPEQANELLRHDTPRDYKFPVIVGVAPNQQTILPTCPHVGCKRPDCDGKHEVTGPCTDKPRGGFEFL